ncbi:retrovirus-related pol polyprotein LINE-1 [Tanacetum coccineum]
MSNDDAETLSQDDSGNSSASRGLEEDASDSDSTSLGDFPDAINREMVTTSYDDITVEQTSTSKDNFNITNVNSDQPNLRKSSRTSKLPLKLSDFIIDGKVRKGIFISKGENFNLKGFSDSDWTKCRATRRSVTGFIVFMGNSVISWKSKKQYVVSRSSVEAEYRALASITCEVMEKIVSGIIKPLKIELVKQLADIFTKGLSADQHNQLLKGLIVFFSQTKDGRGIAVKSGLWRTRAGLEEGGGPNRQPHPERYYSRINQAEVRTTLQKMGRNKAVGPDQIPIEAWRSLGDEGIFWLTSLFNKIFTSAKMPEEWRLSEVIPIFKNKGDAQVCSNYRGIKLLGHTMKLWERVIERRLRRETSVSENQFSFMPERLHQGSAISPYLFTLILDELSKEIQEDIPWCLIFADDIVLVSESAKGLNMRLEDWRKALEDNGLRVSREKTEYLRYDFGNGEITHNEEVDVCIRDKILQPMESFRYLGSILHKSGRIDKDLKGKFYRVAIRPAMLYGSECWPITKALANRVEVAELRMLRWTCGRTLLDMIPNGVYRALLEVETIINKMSRSTVEGGFRDIMSRRRPQSSPVRRVEALVVDGLRRRGRPKLRSIVVDLTSISHKRSAKSVIARLVVAASAHFMWLKLMSLRFKNGQGLCVAWTSDNYQRPKLNDKLYVLYAPLPLAWPETELHKVVKGLGCDAALETSLADIEAPEKAALMKKTCYTLILCLGDWVLREVTWETTAA